MAIADFDKDGQLDLAVFEGAASGLLGQDDLDEAGSVSEPDLVVPLPQHHPDRVMCSLVAPSIMVSS
jgi:hypothetical protein